MEIIDCSIHNAFVYIIDMVVSLVQCGDGIGWWQWWCLVVGYNGHGGLGEKQLGLEVTALFFFVF